MKHPRTAGWLLMLAVASAAGAEQPEQRNAAAEVPPSYTIVSITTDLTVRQPLEKIDTVVQVGTNPNNRFTMHRISHRHGTFKGSIILVPSLVNNFGEYMIDEKQNPMNSLAASLARAHYVVYGYSPRTANLPPRACTSGAVDCSVMKDWNLAAYVQDVEYIRAHAVATHHENPVVGGLSLGAVVGIAAVNRNPTGYAGLLMWEGMLYSADPVIVELNTQSCANLRAATDSGIYYEESLPLLLKDLGRQGEAATITFFGVPQPSLGSPDWLQLVPDPTLTHYQFASFPRVFEFIMAFNNVESLPLLRDVNCSIAGDRTYTANLRQYRAPILSIEAGLAFGPYMNETIRLTGSTNVRVASDPAFGHLDGYLTSNYERYTLRRILEWLRTDVFKR